MDSSKDGDHVNNTAKTTILSTNYPFIFTIIFLQSRLYINCKVCYTNFAKHAIHQKEVMVIKTKIQELRKMHKLSQEELGIAVGVTRQTITSIEVGKYTASLTLAYKIAKYFGMTIEEVFDFSDLED